MPKMASWMCISVCIIAAFLANPVSGARMTNPASVTIGGSSPTQSLTITCQPDASGITQLILLEIGRKKVVPVDPNDPNDPIIQIVTGNTDVNVLDTSFGNRLTSSGSISGSSGSLTMDLDTPTCSDVSRTFYCKTNYLTPGSITDETTANISAQTNPETIDMIVFPDFRVYEVTPVVVEFTCKGRIGNQFGQNNMASYWTWESRNLNDPFPSWTRLNTNITYEDPVSTGTGSCQYTGGSKLTRTVTVDDDQLQIRCYVSGEDYGNNRTILTQISSVTGNPGTGTDPATASTNLGLILGVVFGVLAAIVIVVVLVYFLVFRRKSGGDDYDTGEGKDDRPPMTDNVVYSTPGSRDTKPRNMKGRENDAMDEHHEKNPRPYYPKDYANQGRHNPAMDDDDDSRHDRSYDDDNTDSRMRQGYGSAV